jgi:hypothetical protein
MQTPQYALQRDVIIALDKIARAYDSYEYGLPVENDQVMAVMTLAVTEILLKHFKEVQRSKNNGDS